MLVNQKLMLANQKLIQMILKRKKMKVFH